MLCCSLLRIWSEASRTLLQEYVLGSRAHLHFTRTRQLPVEGQYLADFPFFMTEAAKHGLVWVIDNLDLITGIDEWGFLTRVPKGVCTCTLKILLSFYP